MAPETRILDNIGTRPRAREISRQGAVRKDRTGSISVTVVTPVLNGRQFIGEAVSSVAAQDSVCLEHLVIDGASTDGTIEIIARHESLRYLSEPDTGQANAINKGFRLTGGDIFAFLNADDIYLPGAIAAVVEAFDRHPEAAVVYGEAWYIDDRGERLAPYPVEPFDRERLSRRCFICQPATFIRREAFEAVGLLDESLRFALDYDLWIRLAKHYTFVKIDRPLAASRLHAGAKTIAQTRGAIEETIGVLGRHYGYVPFNWIYGYTHHRLTGQRLAASLPRASARSAWHAFWLGARYNWRHPVRYCRDVIATAAPQG
jgi:glycosyltransferase involved in cell wall biosynthesis